MGATSVATATAANTAATSIANNNRNNRIAADNKRAGGYDSAAAAAKTKKDAAKKAECTHENELLKEETAKLQAVVKQLSALGVAGEGLDMESQGSIAADIEYLKQKLADEKVNSAADHGTCLATSEQDLTDSTKSANDAYGVTEGALTATNTATTTTVTGTRDAAVTAHGDREAHNEKTNSESTSKFNSATTADKKAARELKVAQQTQRDTVGSSSTALATTKTNALAAERSYVAAETQRANTMASDAKAAHAKDTAAKNKDCKEQHDILDEELAVLTAVRGKVESLEVVGNGNDYGHTVTTAPTTAAPTTAAPTTAAPKSRSCVPLHARYYNEKVRGKFLWRERCASLTSTTCESSTEWPRGSGGRCSWSDKAYGLGLTNHHLSHWS